MRNNRFLIVSSSPNLYFVIFSATRKQQCECFRGNIGFHQLAYKIFVYQINLMVFRVWFFGPYCRMCLTRGDLEGAYSPCVISQPCISTARVLVPCPRVIYPASRMPRPGGPPGQSYGLRGLTARRHRILTTIESCRGVSVACQKLVCPRRMRVCLRERVATSC